MVQFSCLPSHTQLSSGNQGAVICLGSLLQVVIVELSVTLDEISVINTSLIAQVAEREGKMEGHFY